MEQTKIPLEKFEKGKFYQVPPKDAERIATRIFQIYDKDANKEISSREIRSILVDIYKGILPQKKFTNEDLAQYFDVLTNHTKKSKITEEDFQKLVNKYFVTYTKDGSLDKQLVEPEMYELNKMYQNKNKNSQDLREFLVKEATKRFGAEFVDFQLKMCKNLFDQHNKDNDQKISYDEIILIFEEIYRKVNFLDKRETLDQEDLNRLLQLMNYDNDGSIGFPEFEIFYLKALLGS
jgi:Ca2+-binding EF-hand superfamily protein